MEEEKKDKRVDALLDSFNFSGSKKKEETSSAEGLVDKFVKAKSKETKDDLPNDFQLREEIISDPKEVKKEVAEKVVQEKTIEPEVSKTPQKNFPLEKLKENLKPEVKAALKGIEKSVSKESVDKLLTTMEKEKNIIFDSKVSDVFENLSGADAAALSKKIAEWEVPKEAGEVNASVIMAWLNKTKK